MKKRIDDILVEKKLAPSKNKAQAFIMAGQVTVDGRPITKPGQQVDEDAQVRLNNLFPYVSRGALKIEKAFKEFNLDFNAKIVCDIGASTGGFTDFALQNGAKKSYAIDVGYGQLDQKLRIDKRVVNLERNHILKIDSLPEKIDYFLIDVSFISLKKIFPQLKKIVQNEKGKYDIIALVKPQFEVGKEVADKFKGVIKDEKIRSQIVSDIVEFTQSIGFSFLGSTESPIEGAKGNKEILIYLQLIIA
jgi:23S rRNA (cytidine1920-2'-O)/16S rRNA (cytidine1409-2'-O)-methyltransferase